MNVADWQFSAGTCCCEALLVSCAVLGAESKNAAEDGGLSYDIANQVDKTRLCDKIQPASNKPKWRNWQTRHVQGVVREIS